MIKVSEPAAASPSTEDRLIALLIPVPTVSCLVLLRVTAPRVIAPVEAPPIATTSVTVTPVEPRLITPLVAVIVPAIFFKPEVATTPAAKVFESPTASPIVVVPLFKNVVVPAIELVPPVRDTL